MERSIGQVDFSLTDKKSNNRKLARSLFVVKDIKKEEKLTEENIRSIRPGDGLHLKLLPNIVNTTATRGLKRGLPLTLDDFK